MSLYGPATNAAINSFPRVSGDEPCADGVPVAGAAFSPRERG